jgi:DNA-binding MarR family transcriptional regulator
MPVRYLLEMPQDTKIVGLLLIDVARILRKRFDQNCRGTGLTRAQWQVLSSLYHSEGMTQGALADRLEVEPITIGRIIDRLEAAGMLERRPHPTDRRAWQLYLLPAAHPVLETLKVIAAETRAELLAGMSEEDVQSVIALLSRMKDNLQSVMAEEVSDRSVKNVRR